MAKYIKQEVPDMKKTGEQKVFYRLKVERNIGFIGLEEGKEMDTIDGSETKRNARSHCKLERAGIVRVSRSPYNKEERLQKAHDYLDENKVLKVSQYMELTGLAYTTAACELRTFSRDASSSIVSAGRGSSTVYVKG